MRIPLPRIKAEVRNLLSLLLQVSFSSLLSPSSLERSQQQIQRTKPYTAAQRSLSKTGYSRTTSPFLQISCHAGMCKQTYISFFFSYCYVSDLTTTNTSGFSKVYQHYQSSFLLFLH